MVNFVRQNTTKTFGPYSKTSDKALLVVDVNGGSVNLQVYAGDDNWITEETISEDSAKQIEISSGFFRVVPFGGATYVWKV